MTKNVYLINRADRPARLLHALDQLRLVRLASHVTRIDACTPEHARQERFARFTERAVANIESRGQRLNVLPSWGAAACMLSHVQCWKHALASERTLSLIVEDDLEFTDPQHFQFQYQKALHALNIRMDTAPEETGSAAANRPYMWCFGAKSSCGTPLPADAPEITRLRGIFTGMHCYLLNRSAAALLLKYCAICTYQVDVQIGMLANAQQHTMNNGLVVYNSAHAGVHQAARFDSDVQPMSRGHKLLPLLFCRKRIPDAVGRVIASYLMGGHGGGGSYGYDGYDGGGSYGYDGHGGGGSGSHEGYGYDGYGGYGGYDENYDEYGGYPI